MKLEVGIYVRTKTLSGQGGISKLEKVDDICITDIGAVDKNNIIKSSPNIIDLIEVGDYVNGYLIDYIDTERRFLRSERPYREKSSWYKDLEEKGKDYNMCLHFKNEDIKSIVTKEQFSQMEYKVVE